MKATSLLMLLLTVVATAHADEKASAILDAFSVKKTFLTMAQEVKPIDMSSKDPKHASDLNRTLSRHYQEKMDLFNQHIRWEDVQPEVVQAIKDIYNQDEIDAIHAFIISKHGASFFEKYNTVGEAFAEAFTEMYTQYDQASFELAKKQHKQIQQHIAEMDKEAESEEPASEDTPREPDIDDIARFSVVTESGSMQGYDVSPGRSPELFKKSAFEEGDRVLSINGIRINDPQNVRTVYDMLKKNSQAYFEVQRGDRLENFVIDIPGLAGTNH